MKKTTQGQDRVEILIAELLLYIRRGKILIAASVCLAIAAALALYAVSPVVYRTSIAVSVGKVGNVQIESEAGIRHYLRRVSGPPTGSQVPAYVLRDNSSSTLTENDLDGILVVDIVAEDADGAASEKRCSEYAEKLVDRHKKIFNDSMDRIRKMPTHSGNPALMTLDSYNFPSRKGESSVFMFKRIADRFDFPVSGGNGMAISPIIRIMLLAGFAAFVCATLLWLCVEYVREGGIRRIMRGMNR